MAKSTKTRRFDFNMDDEDFEELSRGYIPDTTASDTKKCAKLFEDWRCKRNSVKTDQQIPSDILLSDNLHEL